MQIGCLIQKVEFVEEGETEAKNEWQTKILKAIFHDDYLMFLDAQYRGGRERRSTQTELGQFLRKYTPLIEQRSMFQGKRERFWEIPTWMPAARLGCRRLIGRRTIRGGVRSG